MKVFIALAFLAVAASASPSLRLRVTKTNCGPDETECPAGCCPEANWYCCSDNQYCAATPNDCPNGPMILKNLFKKKVAKAGCGPDETECPAGCCPYPGWYCCSDNTHCAATPNDCPNGPKSLKNLLKKKVAKTNCGPDETECPAGCCPEANWYCCSDNQYCAATPNDCPNGPKILKNLLKKKVVKTNCGPDETECPSGCCPYPGWYCCSDNQYCAATPNDCPNGPKILKNLLKKKVAKTNCGPDETECPAGCCPEANWYCCSDNQYCAATPNDCPNGPKILKNLLKKKVAKTNCGPDETECPAGCCPEANWYCCSDNQYCAATPNDCPNGPKILKNLLKKKAPKTNCGPDETECPAGCCPYPGWYCCSDNTHCAATPNDCPNGPKLLKKLLKK